MVLQIPRARAGSTGTVVPLAAPSAAGARTVAAGARTRAVAAGGLQVVPLAAGLRASGSLALVA